LKPPDQVQSFTNHIHALRPLGGAYGLVELVLDLDYILELEWICGENGHTLRIIPGDQNHPMAAWYPGFKLDTVNYIFRCCALNFRVVLGVSHCMEQQNLLIIGQSQRVGSLNSSRLISSYKVI
jgi:hypothetical protein